MSPVIPIFFKNDRFVVVRKDCRKGLFCLVFQFETVYQEENPIGIARPQEQFDDGGSRQRLACPCRHLEEKSVVASFHRDGGEPHEAKTHIIVGIGLENVTKNRKNDLLSDHRYAVEVVQDACGKPILANDGIDRSLVKIRPLCQEPLGLRKFEPRLSPWARVLLSRNCFHAESFCPQLVWKQPFGEVVRNAALAIFWLTIRRRPIIVIYVFSGDH